MHASQPHGNLPPVSSRCSISAAQCGHQRRQRWLHAAGSAPHPAMRACPPLPGMPLLRVQSPAGQGPLAAAHACRPANRAWIRARCRYAAGRNVREILGPAVWPIGAPPSPPSPPRKPHPTPGVLWTPAAGWAGLRGQGVSGGARVFPQRAERENTSMWVVQRRLCTRSAPSPAPLHSLRPRPGPPAAPRARRSKSTRCVGV